MKRSNHNFGTEFQQAGNSVEEYVKFKKMLDSEFDSSEKQGGAVSMVCGLLESINSTIRQVWDTTEKRSGVGGILLAGPPWLMEHVYPKVAQAIRDEMDEIHKRFTEAKDASSLVDQINKEIQESKNQITGGD